MNNTRPIISTTVHGFAPMRPRFAFWGDCVEFDRARHLKIRSITARNDTPRREWIVGMGEILRLVRQAKLKSP